MGELLPQQHNLRHRMCQDELYKPLAISHSQLEDTLIFVAIGAPFLWVMLTRLVFAFLVVWIKHLLTRIPRYHYADLPIKK